MSGRVVIRFRVPADDTTTITFGSIFIRTRRPTARPQPLKTKALEKINPEFTSASKMTGDSPNREQDRVAQETQGAIAETKEHLATSDQGILMLRKMIREAIDAVKQGEDPAGVLGNAMIRSFSIPVGMRLKL